MTAAELRNSTTKCRSRSRVFVRIDGRLVELTGWELKTDHRDTGRFDPATGQPLVEVTSETLILHTGEKS